MIIMVSTEKKTGSQLETRNFKKLKLINHAHKNCCRGKQHQISHGDNYNKAGKKTTDFFSI